MNKPPQWVIDEQARREDVAETAWQRLPGELKNLILKADYVRNLMGLYEPLHWDSTETGRTT
jgi:hypothetical protein